MHSNHFIQIYNANVGTLFDALSTTDFEMCKDVRNEIVVLKSIIYYLDPYIISSYAALLGVFFSSL